LAALSTLFSKFLDTDEMGQEALGPHWSSFTPAQQKEFLGLFRELLQRTYVQKLLLFENPNFVYAGEQSTGAGAVVDTKIVTPRDQFDVTYRLKPAGDTWMATAITVEDVSLTANLGSQLNDLLSRMSVDDLLTLMRRKYGNAGEAAQS
jgi:phospholipid transport system substrate-binding protein